MFSNWEAGSYQTSDTMTNMQVNGSGSFASNEPEPDRAEFVLTSAAAPSGPFGGVVLDRCWLLALKAEPWTAPRRTSWAFFTVRHPDAHTRLTRGDTRHDGPMKVMWRYTGHLARP
ncbi:hypothetical protein Spla01_03119 [Streptomyces platensis]|nr:hypothetical protein BG653_04905 [Streptomyces platensis]